jgi:hypothetical protein
MPQLAQVKGASTSIVAVGTGCRHCRSSTSSALALGQTRQRCRLGRHWRLAVLQQRQILGMELRQEIARRLRRRQLVPEQQGQRLVLPELVEILGRSPPAAHIASRLSAISDGLNPRLRIFRLISRSIIAAVPVWRNASISPGTPA